jgi:hypothetical protein
LDRFFGVASVLPLPDFVFPDLFRGGSMVWLEREDLRSEIAAWVYAADRRKRAALEDPLDL